MPKLKLFLFNTICATMAVALPIRFSDFGAAKPNENFTVTSSPLAKHIGLESLEGLQSPISMASGGSGIGVNGLWFQPIEDSGQPGGGEFRAEIRGPLASFLLPAANSTGGGSGGRNGAATPTVLQSALGIDDATLESVRVTLSAAAGETRAANRSSDVSGSQAGAGANVAIVSTPGTPLTAASLSANSLISESDLTTAAVAPEPSTLLLVGLGLLAFSLLRRSVQ